METKIAKNISQYIELMYSEKSELNQIQDLEERKKTACAKAKLNYDDSAIQEMIHLKNKDVNEQIFNFTKQNNSNKYILLISNQHLFWEQMQQLMEPLKVAKDEDDNLLKDINLKNTISEKSESLLQRIDNLYKEIYKDIDVIEMAGEKIRLMRPEMRLKQQKQA